MPVPEEALVSLLTLRAGEEVEQVLPPGEECPQVSLAQVARQEVEGDHCLLTRLVSVDTDHITRAEHLVAENRIRLILRDVRSGSKCYCWLFGEYSDAFVRLGVKPSDLVVFRNPKVVRTRLKSRKLLPAQMSNWVILCLSKERKLVTFVRVEQEEEEEDMAQSVRPNNVFLDQCESVRPNYVFLAQCETYKQEYNVWAVVTHTEVLEICKDSLMVLRLTDESLSVMGDQRERFKCEILASGYEEMPTLEVGSVVRIHHMTMEVFNGKQYGRVYSGHCVTVVVGGPGHIISPECTARRPGKVLVWSEEDNTRVRQLREVWAGSRVQERTLEEIKDACVSSLSCRLLRIDRVGGDFVLRLEDGTITNILSLEFRGADTQTRDQLEDKETWIDVWVESQDARRDVERLMLEGGDYVKIERLTCLVEDEDKGKSFRFSINSGALQKLDVNSTAVEAINVRVKDVPVRSWFVSSHQLGFQVNEL